MPWRASRSRSSLVRPRTLNHLWRSHPPEGTPLLGLGSCCVPNGRRHPLAGVIVDNDDMATGMEKKEIEGSTDIFWSREPIRGHRGTKDNPAIVPSFNTSRVVGLETEQGVIWFKLEKGPLHLVDGQYFKLQQLDGGDH